MFYGNNIQDTRQLFFSSWKKYLQKQTLLPLEEQIVAVILDHPEYHTLLETTTAEQGVHYFPEMGETNPFLHMGLHLAIRDQVSTDRPVGIKKIHAQLVQKHQDPLKAEHLLMECLAESLWLAQQAQSMPDEAHFLSCCRGLLRD